MRIVVSDFTSLDGVVQAPGGKEEDVDGGFAHGGWSMPYFDVETMGAAIGGALEGSEALLFGRRTWQGMAAAWPSRAGDPFADRMNAIPKYVVSGTLGETDLTWANTTLVRPDELLSTVRELRARDGGDIQVLGSTRVAQALVSADLVDEYLLMVEPVLLGGGKRLFPEDGAARPLKLISATPAATGVLVCVYRPANA